MKVPEQYRQKEGPLGSDETFGNNGFFEIPFESNVLHVIASDGMGWEHVSVSLDNRTPNWKEMCFVKDLFFCPCETVVQFHPKISEYVNNHSHCLHLWKKVGVEFELPDSLLVGIK